MGNVVVVGLDTGFGSVPLTGLEVLRKESAELPDGPSFVTFINGNVGAPAPLYC